MKLLFDQNLSPTLVARVADIFPNSSHVSWLDLDTANDIDIWNFARANDFAIVSKDADFGEMSILRGFPPRIIWLQLGNCTTRYIEEMLRLHREAIDQLTEEEEIGIVKICR